MATNIVYMPGHALPAPVPSGTKSGDALRIGSLNAIAITDRATGGSAVTDTGAPNPSYNWGGGNTTGHASVVFEGVGKFEVTAAAAPTYGAPVYRVAASGLLTLTEGSAPANPLWGHSVDLAPVAGSSGTFVTLVRISNK